jgi:hypothetical protein
MNPVACSQKYWTEHDFEVDWNMNGSEYSSDEEEESKSEEGEEDDEAEEHVADEVIAPEPRRAAEGKSTERGPSRKDIMRTVDTNTEPSRGTKSPGKRPASRHATDPPIPRSSGLVRPGGLTEAFRDVLRADNRDDLAALDAHSEVEDEEDAAIRAASRRQLL